MPFGPDTYTITTESEEMGMGMAQKKAIADARVYCESKGKIFQPQNSSVATSQNKDVYSLTFKCIDHFK